MTFTSATSDNTLFKPTLLPRVTETTVKVYSDLIREMNIETEAGHAQFSQMRVNAVAQFRNEHPGVWNLFLGSPEALDALVTFWVLMAIQEAEDIARAV